MKVILLQDIPGVGWKYDTKDVKPGYWRNCLLPGGLAKEATPEFLKVIETRRLKEAEQKKNKEKEMLDALEGLAGKELVMEMKADEKGNLFAGVKAETISEFLKEKSGIDIAPEFINLKKPIKQIGVHEISVGEGSFKLEVRPQS